MTPTDEDRSSTGAVAGLPMYDWPEVRESTDALWCSLRDSLRTAGIPAPENLSRDPDVAGLWLAPELVLAQTCGLPYATRLRDQVVLLGTPDYAVPGCAAGWYRSAVVVRVDEPQRDLAARAHRRWVYNDAHSQSGYQAMLYYAEQVAPGTAGTWQTLVSGSHRESLCMLAAEQADVAAIDYVSWRLAREHLPAASQLRVLDLTPPTPGLPLIAAAGRNGLAVANQTRDADDRQEFALRQVQAAIETAIDALPARVRKVLGLAGFWRSTPADYDLILQRRRLHRS